MQIYGKGPLYLGRKKIYVEPDETIGSIKQRFLNIFECDRVGPYNPLLAERLLVYQGQNLEDKKTVSDYNIKPESVLRIVQIRKKPFWRNESSISSENKEKLDSMFLSMGREHDELNRQLAKKVRNDTRRDSEFADLKDEIKKVQRAVSNLSGSSTGMEQTLERKIYGEDKENVEEEIKIKTSKLSDDGVPDPSPTSSSEETIKLGRRNADNEKNFKEDNNRIRQLAKRVVNQAIENDDLQEHLNEVRDEIKIKKPKLSDDGVPNPTPTSSFEETIKLCRGLADKDKKSKEDNNTISLLAKCVVNQAIENHILEEKLDEAINML
jgi:hypothetical protein